MSTTRVGRETVLTGLTLTHLEASEQLYDHQVERQKDPDKWRGYPFNNPDLNKIVGGARQKELVVVAAAQKGGKSTWAKDQAVFLAKHIKKIGTDELVLYISLEMGHDLMMARVYANEASIDVTKFRDYMLDEDDYTDLIGVIEEHKDLPILWNVGCYTIAGIKELLNHYQNIRVIVLDYFQLMNPDPGSYGKGFEIFRALSKELKALTNDRDLTIIAVSQQSREALKSFKRSRDPNTLSSTQGLVQDCDLLIFILTVLDDDKEEIPGLRELVVALARNSDVGSCMSLFQGQYARTGAVIDERRITIEEQNETEVMWYDDIDTDELRRLL